MIDTVESFPGQRLFFRRTNKCGYGRRFPPRWEFWSCYSLIAKGYMRRQVSTRQYQGGISHHTEHKRTKIGEELASQRLKVTWKRQPVRNKSRSGSWISRLAVRGRYPRHRDPLRSEKANVQNPRIASVGFFAIWAEFSEMSLPSRLRNAKAKRSDIPHP